MITIPKPDVVAKKQTILSADGNYRFTLWRSFDQELFPKDTRPNGYVNFIAVNPSTADAKDDDATSRRLIAFTQSWGYPAFCITNLFAFRNKDFLYCKQAADPIGPDNDKWLKEIAKFSAKIVCCWGRNGDFMNRGKAVEKMLRDEGNTLHYLRLLSGGVPEHPLYLPKTLAPVLWTA